MKVKSLSHVQLCDPWTVAHQAPPSKLFVKNIQWGLDFCFSQSDNLYSKLEFFIHLHLKYLLMKLGLLPLAYHFFPLIFPFLFVFFSFFFFYCCIWTNKYPFCYLLFGFCFTLTVVSLTVHICFKELLYIL